MPQLVFVLVGQSNLIRAGATTTRATAPADDRLSGSLRWYITRNTDATVTVPQGPGLAFGRTVAVALSRDVVLVGGASSGTTIAHWQRGTPLYAETVIAAAAALVAGGELAALLIAQGETDARSDGDVSLGPLHPDDWHQYLAALVCGLRSDLGTPDLPVLLGLLGPTTSAVHGNWGRVQACQAAVAIPGLVPVDPAPVELLPDGVHWAESSYGQAGRRLAAAYLALGG